VIDDANESFFFSSSNLGDDAEESLALLRRRMATGDFFMTTLEILSRHIRMITPGGYCFLCLYGFHAMGHHGDCDL
jgi:hypothetical protein